MNHYARAIEIITAPNCDFKAIVVAIAMKNPEVVVNVVDAEVTPPWMERVDDCLRSHPHGALMSSQKISAIKIWRAETGCTLREAKMHVEDRQLNLGVGDAS